MKLLYFVIAWKQQKHWNNIKDSEAWQISAHLAFQILDSLQRLFMTSYRNMGVVCIGMGHLLKPLISSRDC